MQMLKSSFGTSSARNLHRLADVSLSNIAIA